MKNFAKFLGIAVIVAVIGFSMAACDDGSKDDNGDGNSTLNGTWVNTAEGIKIVLNNGAITISNDNVEMMKGTCSTSGSNITITITQVTGAVFEASDLGITASQWYTQQQLKTAVIQVLVSDGLSQSEAEEMYDEMFENSPFGSSTGTYTLSGNTLTVTWDGTPMVVTRQ